MDKSRDISLLRAREEAPTLTRRQIVQGAVALAASSLLSGCGSSNSTPAPQPVAQTNPQPVPAGSLTQASLTVTATAAGSIGAAFAGLSYEKSQLYGPLFTASNTDLIGIFQRLGPSILRIGGNSVDRNVWTPNGPGQTVGQIAPSDVDSLAAFVKAAGWQCLYGINLGGAATGATTPALAAAEVAYAAQQFGSSLLGIEIGNEPDLYGDTGNYFAGNWSLSQFLTLWGQFRAAILASTPGVPITGPADASNEATWTVPFGQTVTKSEITLLTQHYYRANGQLPTSTAAYLITPDPTLIADLAILEAGAPSIGVPYRMSECNSFYNGGASGVSDSYASSLWVIDYLFNCVQGGAVGVNFHGGGDGTGYTPIANSAATVVARPEFYGILLFTLASQGTLYTTQVDAGTLNVTAYAVKTSSGGLNLIVVNKDLTQNLQLTTQLPGSASSATLLAMTQLTSGATGPNLSATSGVTIQGASVNPDGTFSPAAAYTLEPSGSQLTCYVPALSAVLIQIVS
ncbi:MAG: hypothetical protein WB869_07855 [Candidatus Acidiferrales bacterium]